MKLVSIITPVFNCEKYIEETYLSIKEQTYPNWEWICVDDQSEDQSFNLLQKLAQHDQRITLIQNSVNSGAAITRNKALDLASGSYYAFLDADDLWEKNKLEAQINFMEDQTLDFSYHDYTLIDQNNNKLKDYTPPNFVTASSILKYNPFATSSIMLTSSIAKDVRFKEHLRRRQDYIYWFEALKKISAAKKLPLKLSYYKVDSSSSLSANKKTMALIQWRLLKEEFQLNFFIRTYYFFCYALNGIKKYF